MCASGRFGIFVGFAAFFVMEKTMRVLGSGDEGHGHGHSHSHAAPAPIDAHASGVSTARAGGPDGHQELKSRTNKKKEDGGESKTDEAGTTAAQTSKLSAYLNLFGDFVHNM